MDDLRGRLRSDTRSSHDRLDRHVSTFDLGEPDGLRSFLAMQLMALTRLEPLAKNSICAPAIHDLRARAEFDLRGLDETTALSCPDLTFTPHPMSVDYVIAGSRVGTAILRKRWLASKNAEVRATSAYFSAPTYMDMWRAFCDRATRETSSGPQADRIVGDAIGLFDFYGHCAASACA
ncbi:biliverdin-producing heme oxygenase [Tropicimonas isoalkanivorans]|uniref:biliverdin-producing heme oxygenase n=1 Tax=Tropicimonas isoalkanivorans TaxID=441112 RepID=UPI0011606331|nr:biliverdin-producing heme oxygenase [Tropicimonas isoalkanivorans]